MQYLPHTKIVATLGPASSSREAMTAMIRAGANVFRLNFSHGTREEHRKTIEQIKSLNDELSSHVAILADLQGPKLRVGEIENNHIDLCEGDTLRFVTEKCLGTKDHIYISYAEFPKDVSAGELILVDDGKIKLEVTATDGKSEVMAKVLNGGPLSSHKGVNLPNTNISLPCLTDEDLVNAQFALDNDVDWLALSFVRCASDVLTLKRIVRAHKSHCGVIAKIEKPEAIAEIDNIIRMADAVMVARGDLGVEVSFDRVPLMQKQIVQKCLTRAKPVIIATQMMESMMTNFRPTRAEATDVANAVLDGADALMLSGETSVGKYPAETIASMRKIIEYTEVNGRPYDLRELPAEGTPSFLSNSICYNAARLAYHVHARVIVAFTHSGYTAFRLASHRPETPIYAFTDDAEIVRKLSLVWGVRPNFLKTYDSLNEVIETTTRILKKIKLVHDGDILIHVGSTPLKLHGSTNMLKVSSV